MWSWLVSTLTDIPSSYRIPQWVALGRWRPERTKAMISDVARGSQRFDLRAVVPELPQDGVGVFAEGRRWPHLPWRTRREPNWVPDPAHGAVHRMIGGTQDAQFPDLRIGQRLGEAVDWRTGNPLNSQCLQPLRSRPRREHGGELGTKIIVVPNSILSGGETRISLEVEAADRSEQGRPILMR